MTRDLAAAGWTRRQFVITLAAGSALAATLGPSPLSRARAEEPATLAEAMQRILGDRQPADGAGIITLDLPQIAENGNTVPLTISVDSPMTADDHVKAVHVFASGNPRPDVVSFRFSPRSGRAEASTRMRLAKTQKVVTVAEMSDGKAFMTQAEVKVTIGGCGG